MLFQVPTFHYVNLWIEPFFYFHQPTHFWKLSLLAGDSNDLFSYCDTGEEIYNINIFVTEVLKIIGLHQSNWLFKSLTDRPGA
jgi:hypothetical protein